MAESNPFDLTRLEQIERRLQVLEDAEAIRNLKARYAALCDNQYDADGIASLFTEDAVWESPALGRFEGRNAIRNFFRGASGIFSFAIHYSLDGRIEVDGDTARARWYLFMPCTLAAAPVCTGGARRSTSHRSTCVTNTRRHARGSLRRATKASSRARRSANGRSRRSSPASTRRS